MTRGWTGEITSPRRPAVAGRKSLPQEAARRRGVGVQSHDGEIAEQDTDRLSRIPLRLVEDRIDLVIRDGERIDGRLR